MNENNELVMRVVSDIWCAIVERASRLDYGTAKVVMDKIANNHSYLKQYHNLPVEKQIGVIGATFSPRAMYDSYVRYTNDTQGWHTEEFAEKLYELAYIDALMDLVPKEVYDHMSRFKKEN